MRVRAAIRAIAVGVSLAAMAKEPFGDAEWLRLEGPAADARRVPAGRGRLFRGGGALVRPRRGSSLAGVGFLFQLLWSGKLDPAMAYPQTFEVDYVRVYA